MRRPRLTKNIVDGLNSLQGEISVTIDARQGCGDVFDDDVNALRALEYLRQLVAWYHGDRCRKRP